jgi:hypothetical protein
MVLILVLLRLMVCRQEISGQTTNQGETSSSLAPQIRNNEADFAANPIATEDQDESMWSSTPSN